jgi:hypothetical protein
MSRAQDAGAPDVILRLLVRTLGGALLVWAFATPSHLTAQAGYPRSFTDGKGHRVTLTSKPAGIASVVLGADERSSGTPVQAGSDGFLDYAFTGVDLGAPRIHAHADHRVFRRLPTQSDVTSD